ncbi:MAG: DUF6456 domain-containing protein [Hyphomicrobiaceae bacterium]
MRTKSPVAALARLLSVLARQGGAIRIVPASDGDPSSPVLEGLAVNISPVVVAMAEQTGLIECVDGKHRILPPGLAWLKRRLSGGDGYAEQHQALVQREIGIGAMRSRVLVNEQESPLAWLRRRADKSGKPILSDAQFEAGERLRSDFWHAGMSPRVTASWNGLASTGRSRRSAPDEASRLRDSVAGAQQRVRRALEEVGPELAGILVDVCCHLKGLEASETARGWPQRSGKVVLLLALSRLARHYGLLVSERGSGQERVRLTSWGDADYRPTLGAWAGKAE